MPAVLPLTDRCYLGASASGTDGEPTPVYTYGETATPCAVINFAPSSVAAEDSHGLQLPMGAVRIAFRADAAVTAETRVRVYRRLRATLSPVEDYIVDGAPRLVRGRLVAVCRRTSARSAK